MYLISGVYRSSESEIVEMECLRNDWRVQIVTYRTQEQDHSDIRLVLAEAPYNKMRVKENYSDNVHEIDGFFEWTQCQVVCSMAGKPLRAFSIAVPDRERKVHKQYWGTQAIFLVREAVVVAVEQAGAAELVRGRGDFWFRGGNPSRLTINHCILDFDQDPPHVMSKHKCLYSVELIEGKTVGLPNKFRMYQKAAEGVVEKSRCWNCRGSGLTPCLHFAGMDNGVYHQFSSYEIAFIYGSLLGMRQPGAEPDICEGEEWEGWEPSGYRGYTGTVEMEKIP